MRYNAVQSGAVLQVESSKWMSVCMCMCECACACVCVRVCVHGMRGRLDLIGGVKACGVGAKRQSRGAVARHACRP